MNIQRLRNLTTGVLHTEEYHVYEDIEFLTGIPGIFSHMIPDALKAMKPWLKHKVPEADFWNGRFDSRHIGGYEIHPMTEEERNKFFYIYAGVCNR